MLRGYAFELFAAAKGRFTEENGASRSQFSIEADLTAADGRNGRQDRFRYAVEVEIGYRSGTLANRSEYLSALSKDGRPKGKPAIEVIDGQISIRRQSGGGRPRKEGPGLNYAMLSDARFASPAYKYIDRARTELRDWRAYYLDPRMAMRAEMPPMDVVDIGVFGRYIVPFLYKLKGERPRRFEAIRRTVRTIIPSIATFDVALDPRGMLDFYLMQDDTLVSSQIVSEGTLRVLALCALTVNPWNGTLLAFEEPENGVHPRRIELIAKMLVSLALDHRRQVVVTTHSPLFYDAVLQEARSRETDDVGLFNVRREGAGSVVEPLTRTARCSTTQRSPELSRCPRRTMSSRASFWAGSSMNDDLPVDFFVEDSAHERIIVPLTGRIAADEGMALRCR